MKKFKKVLFGYKRDEVDALIESYESIIEKNEQNIKYLKNRLKNEGLNKSTKKEQENEEEIKQVIEDIQSTINK